MLCQLAGLAGLIERTSPAPRRLSPSPVHDSRSAHGLARGVGCRAGTDDTLSCLTCGLAPPSLDRIVLEWTMVTTPRMFNAVCQALEQYAKGA